MKPTTAILTLTVLAIMHCAGAVINGLDGATGNICKVNLEQRSFEWLKETEYDPKTDLQQSRFTVYWNDETAITKIDEASDSGGIKEPVTASFHGIDAANSKALEEGRPFITRVATLFHNNTSVTSTEAGIQRVIGRFTPSAGASPRGGMIELDGKQVEVSLRKNNSRIFVHQPLNPADLAKGFWKATIHGSEAGGRFVIHRMEVQPLVDPRATDDPKLPRVLVVGDSISMNYHEAAKAALKGVANYHRNEGNSFSTAFGVTNMELWLGDYKEPGLHWNVIQFNHGLHDLKQAYDAATDTFGDYAVPIEDYKKNLEKEIAILKKTGAKLIWCSTTPVPNDNKSTYARRKGAEREFNEAAMEVMRRHPEIQVNDLCGLIDNSPVFDDWRKTTDVHFYKEDEQNLLGDAVASAVRKALGKDAKAPSH